MYCHKCGAELRDDAQFCSKCGAVADGKISVADTVDVAPAAPAETIPVPGNKTPWRNWGLIVVLLIVLGGGGVIGWRILSKPKLGDVRTNPKDKAEMVWVPGGTFTMGSPEGVGYADEHPAHQVILTGFWLYKYEVTVAQYRAFCTATKRALPEFPDGYSWKGKRGWNDPGLQQHPIVNVSWHDAQAYAAWAKVTLPTEAQWEYAARGPEGRNYPWGGIATADKRYDGWDARKSANNENSYEKKISTWQVGSFPAGASWCGAQDMAGNVWEWCADCYGDYSATQVTNPSGPATGKVRVLRGGSWGNYYDYDYGRSACRSGNDPNFWDFNVGFRCVSLSPGR